jgi:polyvinyl alcohol dehydrogenase (cytochrome)
VASTFGDAFARSTEEHVMTKSAMRKLLVCGLSVVALGLSAASVNAQTPGATDAPSAAEGATLFDQRCKSCHEPAIERAPSRGALAVRPASEIAASLTNGAMAPMAAGLSPVQIQSLVQYLVQAPEPTKQTARAPAPVVPTIDKMCATNPPIQGTKGDWASVGRDANKTRYQPEPGLKAADVSKLKVKWSFAIANSRNAQPVVIGDWLWLLSGGRMYALDPKSGCVRYRVDDVSARNTPDIFKSTLSPSGWMMIVGRNNKIATAFDAQTGKQIWASEKLDAHGVSGVTGSPTVSGNQVFVPITSLEEPASQSANYACCSFRGNLVALDLATGATQWKTVVITEPTQLLGKNTAGVQMQGPAGGAIWSAPTADAKRGVVYVATGDSYTDVDTKGADAIVAIDTKTGAIKWSTQVTEKDNFVMGCTGAKVGPNCPTPLGPDYDFGASPILFTLPSGKQVVLSGQKSSIAYGMDASTGKVLWKRQTGAGSALGGIEWGMAADTKRLFAPNSDIVNLWDEHARSVGKVVPDMVTQQPPAKPGLTAIDPATGKVVWHVDAPKAPCQFRGDRTRSDRYPGVCFNAMSAAPAAMPGVVFQGSTDGWFRAYSADKGKVLWEDSTTSRTYATTNGVEAQPGGSLDGNGPTIANGMVFVMSGFDGAASTGGNGTNVLLAYSVEGK